MRFGDGWPPSRTIKLALENLEPLSRGRARIAHVDAKGSPNATTHLGITCFQTTPLFEGGHVVGRFLGTAMPWEIEAALQVVLPQAPPR